MLPLTYGTSGTRVPAASFRSLAKPGFLISREPERPLRLFAIAVDPDGGTTVAGR